MTWSLPPVYTTDQAWTVCTLTWTSRLFLFCCPVQEARKRKNLTVTNSKRTRRQGITLDDLEDD
eukprot:1270282-Pyramimonas_sp.AAC.1